MTQRYRPPSSKATAHHYTHRTAPYSSKHSNHAGHRKERTAFCCVQDHSWCALTTLFAADSVQFRGSRLTRFLACLQLAPRSPRWCAVSFTPHAARTSTSGNIQMLIYICSHILQVP
jgi:hypothetical protein